MTSKKRAIELIHDCLDELYQNATPAISWDECQNKYVGVKEWWARHIIDGGKYEEIVERYKKKIGPTYRGSLEMALLNYGPMEKVEE